MPPRITPPPYVSYPSHSLSLLVKQAIGLSLYEELGTSKNGAPSTTEEKLGREVIRTQWLGESHVSEVPCVTSPDDSRMALLVRIPRSFHFVGKLITFRFDLALVRPFDVRFATTRGTKDPHRRKSRVPFPW